MWECMKHVIPLCHRFEIKERIMGLSIIYGKSGSGKSSFLFKKVKEKIAGAQKIYIITPEQFSFTAERRLLIEGASGAAINAEVLTFSRMAYRVMAEIGSPLKRVEGFGKSMLIFDILESSKGELRFLGKNLQNVEVAERSITEFKKHNITENRLFEISKNIDDKYLRAKLEDMSLIYSKFQEAIQNKFLDENDSLYFLAENIKNSSTFDDSIIFIDEFVRIYSAGIYGYRGAYEGFRGNVCDGMCR